MKKPVSIKIGILLLTLTVISAQYGCKKFVDRKPLSTFTTGDVPGSGFEGAVLGLYAHLRQDWGMSDVNFITMNAARADDNDISTPGDGNSDVIDNYNYTKDFWMSDNVWNAHYSFVINASGVLDDIENAANASDPAVIVNKAEASFLRAYAYFNLVRNYGDIPKIDFKVTTPLQANVEKSPASEIYALIQSDLEFAVANLPESWSSIYVGRVTNGTASTLLAKVKLYQKDWAGALSNAEAVIISNHYALLPNFSDVFTEEHENSLESIFEIQNYENATGSIGSNGSLSSWSAGYQGVRAGGNWNLGWGWNIPDTSLVNSAFEPNDPRKGQTILFSGHRDDTLINDGKYGNILPPSIWPYFNKKVYTDPARRSATGDFAGSWLDQIILRYSDVLLMAAEAANETGNTAKALGYLEQVRARARNGNPNILPPVTSTDQVVVRNAIKHERRVEFAMEYERFYDLVRWGDAEQVLGPRGYKAKNALFPIPQSAIDKSNDVLTQNPGY
jgi:starch-binding outer membrane protein, SusD/RagB family